jgi:hypothetical protein
MTELDLEIPVLATELIEEYGKEIGYTQREPGEYDTNTSMAVPTENPKVIKAIVEPYRGQRMVAGLVEAGDLKVTIAAESFADFDEEPSTGDICFIDGNPFNVVNALATYSGELKAIWEFQVRAG